MATQFTDSNLHRFEVRGEIFGEDTPHVVIEQVNKTGSPRRQYWQSFEMILNPAEVATLIEAMQTALANPERAAHGAGAAQEGATE